MNKFWEFIEGSLGKRVTFLILVFIVGFLTMKSLPSFVVTTADFIDDKDEIYAAMNAGDMVNKVEIINIQLDDSRNEKMKLQNFIDMQQEGVCTENQRRRLDELEKTIQRLELQREELYRQFTPVEKMK